MSSELESLIRAALLLAAIFVLTAIGITIARKWRGRDNQETLDANEIMSNFREVYEQGGLSEEEFRTIKAKLASDLKRESNDARNAG
jgi:uncharacterized membrane protein